MVQLNVIESKFPWGLLFGIFGRGVVPELPRSPNPGPILDQNVPVTTPVFRLGVSNPYPFSGLKCKGCT